jgi:hypothetical protein
MWTLYYAPAAIAGMYKVPRGVAAEVTAAIADLQREPIPTAAVPDPTGLAHTYAILVAEHTITYAVMEAIRGVRILAVE